MLARPSCRNATASRSYLKQPAAIHSFCEGRLGTSVAALPSPEAEMMTAHQTMNGGWTRLEAVLTEMKPGETISIDALAADSGLSSATVLTVLKELQRVELFARQEEKVFVRRSLWQETGRSLWQETGSEKHEV